MQHFIVKCCICLYTIYIEPKEKYLTSKLKKFLFLKFTDNSIVFDYFSK